MKYGRRTIKCGTSKFRGVSWDKLHNRWRVTIHFDSDGIYRTKYIGLFYDEIDAARAYDKVAIEYHKESATLNFPIGKV